MKNSMTYPDCWSDDRRMKVLFSPLRQRNVNPENYDGQVLFWRTQITNYASTQQNPRVTLSGLRSAFIRNGEKPHCLQDVLATMMAKGEIKPLDQFLQSGNAGWSAWLKKPLQIGAQLVMDKVFSPNKNVPEVPYVVLEVVNAQADAIIKSLKNQILTRADVKKRLSEWNISEEALPLVLHEVQCRQKVVTKHLSDEDDADVKKAVHHDDDERTVLKFGTESHKAFPFTEIELSIHKLEFTERDLIKAIGKMEEQIHEHEEQARKLLAEKKRVLAKNSLRKRDSTTKRLEKRVQCLENVQSLLQRIHDVTDDAAVLDAYRTGTKSLQTALSKSGITLDTVDEAINQMQDVIALHDEVKSAIAMGTNGVPSDDAELERELEELVRGEEPESVGRSQTKKQEEQSNDNDDDLVKELEKLEIASHPLPDGAGATGDGRNEKEEVALCL